MCMIYLKNKWQQKSITPLVLNKRICKGVFTLAQKIAGSLMQKTAKHVFIGKVAMLFFLGT